MLLSIKLTNFKCHRDLEVNFSAGLQAIRGSVEAGKSSLLEGIAYAFGGARALNDSIALVVTEGEPLSSLKVELEFQHEGVTFRIVRGPSGAELTGPGVTASGQDGVTTFVENLFGCSMKVAPLLMFAPQGELRGSLTGNGSVSLIEKLADVEVLDRLIDKIQTNLPSGNTRLLEAQIGELVGIEKPVLDVDEAMCRVAVEEYKLESAEGVVTDLQVKQIDDAAAHKVLQDLAVAQSKLAAAEIMYAENEKILSTHPVSEPSKFTLDELRVKQQEFHDHTNRLQTYERFLRMTNRGPEEYAGTYDELIAEIDMFALEIKEAEKEFASARTAIKVKESQMITETACGLCGKDLTEIPEVVKKNANLKSGIDELIVKVHDLQESILTQTKDRNGLMLVKNIHDMRVMESQSLPLENLGGIPANFKWVGSIPEGEAKDYSSDIKKQEAIAASELIWANKQEQARKVLESLDIAGLRLYTSGLESAGLQAREQLTTSRQLRESLSEAVSVVSTQQLVLAKVRADLQAIQAAYAHDLAAYEKSQEQLKRLVQELSLYELHNGLIKKIREVRPVVGKRLWGVVLSAVSQYFTSIRGVESVVTRGDSGFLINGRPVSTLSGSTKDSLGLAIRLALMQTFLPTIRWSCLDEPGAACNDERESNMLALLTKFDQTVLVTHSDIADAYAANVIQL